jgi:putative ABC transport system ATP-binding protein
MAAMIRFQDVHKVYNHGRNVVTALDGVDIEIVKGEFVAVMGPSGSGKSTLLHLAGGLDLPTKGEVILGGKSTSTMNDDELTLFRRTQIGFVFQFFNLIPTLTVLENAALPLLLGGGRLADARPKTEAILDRLGLKPRLSHLPEELAGGEMQRVAIARALVTDPPILLADEPTGNLDSATGAEILAILSELSGGRTILMVTHSQTAAYFAKRTIKLQDGKVK